MAEEMKNLYNEFDEYDESMMLPTGVSEAELKSYSYGNAPAKIKAFNNILKRVELGLNKTLMGLNISVKTLKIKNTFSAGIKSRSAATKFSILMSGDGSSLINMDLNANVNKILNYPALEIYSLFSTMALRAILGGLNKEELEKLKTQNSELSQNAELLTSADITKNSNNKSQYEVSKWFLCMYLKEFLPSYFGYGEVDNIDYIAELVANELLGHMNEWEIAQLSSTFFKFDKLDSRAAHEGRKYFQSGNSIYPYRTAKIQEKANRFALNPEEDFTNKKALGAEQQYLALSSTFAGRQAEVKDALSGGFSNDNEKLKNFCRAYAESFMQSNGLKNIDVVFVNEGDCQYFDRGDSHEIRINLNSPVLRSGSVAELVMTMSHELTHAVDSSINKNNLNTTSEGYGLVGSMNGNFDGLNIDEKAMPLLNRVQAYCYQLDPNERHGRIGEISALKFLSDVYAGDSEMAEQLQESVNVYTKYQLQTINAAEGLGNVIANFEAELAKLGTQIDSKAYKMIEERIEYLKNINSSLDVSAERNSIEDAYKAISERANYDRKKDAERQNVAEILEKQ